MDDNDQFYGACLSPIAPHTSAFDQCPPEGSICWIYKGTLLLVSWGTILGPLGVVPTTDSIQIVDVNLTLVVLVLPSTKQNSIAFLSRCYLSPSKNLTNSAIRRHIPQFW